jgi:hypothetical protein
MAADIPVRRFPSLPISNPAVLQSCRGVTLTMSMNCLTNLGVGDGVCPMVRDNALLGFNDD